MVFLELVGGYYYAWCIIGQVGGSTNAGWRILLGFVELVQICF